LESSGVIPRVLHQQALTSVPAKGFEARATFDRQLARRFLESNDEVAYPHHGVGRCTCQYIVLQISRPGGSPSAVVRDGSDNSTRVALISAADEKVDATENAVQSKAQTPVSQIAHPGARRMALPISCAGLVF